jgi:hypothetical protein
VARPQDDSSAGAFLAGANLSLLLFLSTAGSIMNARLRTAALVNLAMVVEQANEQVRQRQQQQQQAQLQLGVVACCSPQACALCTASQKHYYCINIIASKEADMYMQHVRGTCSVLRC